MSTPSPSPAEKLIEEAAKQITCDYGHPGQPDYGRNPPCQNPPEYSSTTHNCEEGDAVTLWCSSCLAGVSLGLQKLLKAYGRFSVHLSCGMPVNKIGDLLWDLAPLKK